MDVNIAASARTMVTGNVSGCASTEGIWSESYIWKIQVIESMVSGLYHWKLLQQKWLAYKSLLVSIEILASKSSDADQCRAPRETIEKKVSRICVDFGPEGGVDLAWMFWAGKKGLKKFRAISGQNS